MERLLEGFAALSWREYLFAAGVAYISLHEEENFLVLKVYNIFLSFLSAQKGKGEKQRKNIRHSNLG